MSVELLGKSASELGAFCESLGEPAYRGKQIYRALYAQRRFDFAAATNLPAAFRARLAIEARIDLPRVARRVSSGAAGGGFETRVCRGRVHALGKAPDDLHFDSGRLRCGLPLLPDRAAWLDSQPKRRRDYCASFASTGRSESASRTADQCRADGPG